MEKRNLIITNLLLISSITFIILLKRVKKEDIIPFGKKIGFGSIIIGLSIIIAAFLALLNYTFVSDIVIGLGIAIGLTIIFYAMIKYNKGIF